MTATVAERIKASIEYLGGGTYSTLSPVITKAGLEAGWRYTYAIGINRDGVSMRDAGETLDTLEAAGLIELRTQNQTAF